MRGPNPSRQMKTTMRRSPLGPASVAANAEVPRMTVQSRYLWQPLLDTETGSTAAAPEESFLGTGSTYASRGLDYSLRDFLTSVNQVANSYDQYRIVEIEVYAIRDTTVVTSPMFIASSVDLDDTATPTWGTLSQRSNVAITTMNPIKPMVLIAKWKPVANFNATTGDNPANMIPRAGQWFDTSIINQSFNGLKVNAAAEQNFGSLSFRARARVEFRGRI